MDPAIITANIAGFKAVVGEIEWSRSLDRSSGRVNIDTIEWDIGQVVDVVQKTPIENHRSDYERSEPLGFRYLGLWGERYRCHCS